MLGFIHFGLLLFSLCDVKAYSNFLYTIAAKRETNANDVLCESYETPSMSPIKIWDNDPRQLTLWTTMSTTMGVTAPRTTTLEKDPMDTFQNIIKNYLFGASTKKDEVTMKEKLHLYKPVPDHFPSGDLLRGDLYQNRSSVHLPLPEYLHQGHMRLNITMDFMQTAVNAFAIFHSGKLTDILRLPSDYVLHSARSISMMTIAREKLAATWTVVKSGMNPIDISYRTLELYRPLFKYLNGKEMGKLNLSDPRILTYIGTHAELDRHQVGVVANRYVKKNTEWSDPKYLNMMNNLLCGVPMTFMRKIPENTYLQLSHQIFYHIHACDPLQRRFYLAMMTRSQALGKSYSWNARDVSRLGLLLAEVDGPDLSAINPEAMPGITSHVMATMDPQKLTYFTEAQLNLMEQKPLNILTRKVRAYQDRIKIYNSKSMRVKSAVITSPFVLLFLVCK